MKEITGATACEIAIKAVDTSLESARIAAKMRPTLDGKVAAHRLVKQLELIRRELRVIIFDCEDAEAMAQCNCEYEVKDVRCARCGRLER